jgi:Tat protein translocase TatB subunit
MNLFSNIGITELVVILLLALLVVGPERLPELARQLGKILRDFRTAYENLTKDLGPELMSIQETTRELRESVESVRSIPRDMVKQVVDAADLDETIDQLKEVEARVDDVGKTLSATGRTVRDPVSAAGRALKGSLSTEGSDETEVHPDVGEELPAGRGPLAPADVDGPGQVEGQQPVASVEADSEKAADESRAPVAEPIRDSVSPPEPEPFDVAQAKATDSSPGQEQADSSDSVLGQPVEEVEGMAEQDVPQPEAPSQSMDLEPEPTVTEPTVTSVAPEVADEDDTAERWREGESESDPEAEVPNGGDPARKQHSMEQEHE